MITFVNNWGDSIEIAKTMRGDNLSITTKDSDSGETVNITISFDDFNSLAERVTQLTETGK